MLERGNKWRQQERGREKKGPIKGVQQEELGSVRLMMSLIHPKGALVVTIKCIWPCNQWQPRAKIAQKIFYTELKACIAVAVFPVYPWYAVSSTVIRRLHRCQPVGEQPLKRVAAMHKPPQLGVRYMQLLHRVERTGPFCHPYKQTTNDLKNAERSPTKLMCSTSAQSQ